RNKRMDAGNMAVRKSIWHWSRLLPLALLLGAAFFFPARHAVAQSVSESQAKFLRGDYDAVITSAQAVLAENSYRSDWRELLVKSLMMQGRYGEAYTNAIAGMNDYSPDLPLRLLALETALFQNKNGEANRRLEEIKYLLEQRP